MVRAEVSCALRHCTLAEGVPRGAQLLLVDEAAQLEPAAIEELLTARGCGVALAATVDGYEGTGQALRRSLGRLAALGAPLRQVALEEPVRWPAGDAVERLVDDALLLRAAPREHAEVGAESAELVKLRRGDLLEDEALLREVYGLL
ncbi:unnamed protein product, partial [Prorocentrum cordatum]